jgi:murein DD-endopeptidase MepM/ murein hydrolase activator NlpD
MFEHGRLLPAVAACCLALLVTSACGPESAPEESRVFGDVQAFEGTPVALDHGTVNSDVSGGESEGAIPAARFVSNVPAEASELPYLVMPVVTWPGFGDSAGAERIGGLVHGGLDLMLAGRTDVFAPCDGEVLQAGATQTYGGFVIVDCNQGWTAVVGLLDEYAVASGDIVRAGESRIGIAGNHATELHLEIRFAQWSIDPLTVFDLAVVPGTPRPVTPTPTAAPTATPRPRGPSGAATAEPTGEVPSPGANTPAPTTTPSLTPTPSNTPTPAPTSTPTPRPEPPTPTPLPRAF